MDKYSTKSFVKLIHDQYTFFQKVIVTFSGFGKQAAPSTEHLTKNGYQPKT